MVQRAKVKTTSPSDQKCCRVDAANFAPCPTPTTIIYNTQPPAIHQYPFFKAFSLQMTHIFSHQHLDLQVEDSPSISMFDSHKVFDHQGPPPIWPLRRFYSNGLRLPQPILSRCMAVTQSWNELQPEGCWKNCQSTVYDLKNCHAEKRSIYVHWDAYRYIHAYGLAWFSMYMCIFVSRCFQEYCANWNSVSEWWPSSDKTAGRKPCENMAVE